MKIFFTGKCWKLMKICAAQGFIAILMCGVSLAHTNYGQVLDREVSVDLKEASFENALAAIASETNTFFSYSPDLLSISEKVTLKVNKKPLAEVLDILLLPHKIYYAAHHDNYTIFLKKEKKLGLQIDRAANEIDKFTRQLISGKVVDSNNEPMVGVNILIKGTTNGTTSDGNGHYSITAEPEDIIVFSFIGFKSVELLVANQTAIDVTLMEDLQSLSEVVVNVGYWEVKKEEQTGNVSRVTNEQIAKQNVSNPLQALQGRMTGVYIQQNTGAAGGGFTIQVRGQNSLRTGSNGDVNGNLPLYIVDGVPFTSTSLNSPAISNGNLGGGNPLSNINPNDIESIEVLKDADATAVYGSRGANGVVLITTKRAKAGKARMDFDIYQGIGKASHKMNLLSTAQYIQMRNEAFANDEYAPSVYDAPDLLQWDTTRYTDWQKLLIGGTSNLTNANLGFSGGSDRTQFLVNGGYYRETSVFPGSNAFQRGNGRVTINHLSADKRFNLSSSVNYSISSNNIPSIDFTGTAVTLSPNAPSLFDDNGNLNWANSTWSNPWALLRRKYEGKTDNLVANAMVSYEVIKGLTAKATLGYTSMNVNELSTNPLSAYNPLETFRRGSSSFGTGKIKTWITEPQVEYTKAFGALSLTSMIGTTFQQSVQEQQTIQATGYTSDVFLENLKAAPTVNIADNIYTQYRYSALFGRINLNWGQRYIVNITGRRDGSSRFGPGNQFGNFGAVGAAWIFSNENFLRNSQSFFSFGKLRASYGSTGSDAIGNYQYLETYAPASFSYGTSRGLVLTRLANPKYSWETNRKFESAIELAGWENRINFSAAYYRNRATNQLVGLPLPLMTGQSSVQFNLPATVQNSGWEFEVASVNIKSNSVEWSTSFNITLPSNKLLEFPDLNAFPSYANRYDIGKSTFTYKGFEFNQVDPSTGFYKFYDQNNDGSISSTNDLIGKRKVTQAYYGGIGNTIRYGDVSLDFLFQFVKQTGYSFDRSLSMPGGISNQPVEIMNRWQKSGDISPYQRFTAVDPTGDGSLATYYYLSSDRIITDASFIRLRNISLSWQFPKKWTTKMKLQSTRIYVQGQNLLTITNYIGMDPETQNSLALPPLRMLTAGLHVTL